MAGLLVAAEREGRAESVVVVGALSRALGEGGAEVFLAACAKAPEALAALPMGDGVQPYIRRALGLPSGDIDAAIAQGCGDIDEEGLRVLHDFNLGWGTKSGLERAALIRDWLDLSPAERVTGLETLHGVWAQRDGEVRSFGKGQAPQAADADLLARGLAVGRDYAAAYRAAKRRAGAGDFDDLIRATVDLLRQDGSGDWIRYKLDQATEHVLIDEAQDTNAQQWASVRSIVSEYFSGQGTRGDRVRTLFTVGDKKQAIFGFQGTDPEFFNAAEQLFSALADVQSEIDEIEPTPFEHLSLTASFRSTAPVLQFVDAALEVLPEGALGAVEREMHASKVPGPGQVNLWAPTLPEEGGEDEDAWIADAGRAHR